MDSQAPACAGVGAGKDSVNHLRVAAATIGASDARVDELLNLVDLGQAGGRKAGGYSMGMRQRLALARNFYRDSPVIISLLS